MKAPKDVLTASGTLEYLAHVINARNALFFIREHFDVLEMDYEDMELIEQVADLLDKPKMLEGDR